MAFDSSAPSTIIIGNSVRDSPIDPLVPAFLEDSSDLVNHYLSINETFARTAFTEAQTALAGLVDAQFPQNLPDPPDPPSVVATANLSTGLNFDSAPSIGALVTSSPGPFTPEIPDVPDVSSQIPEYVPVITGVAIPDVPSTTPVTLPTVPTVETDFVVGDAPTPDYGLAPTLTEYALPVFVPPVLPLFAEDAPTFDTAPPSPVIQWNEPSYVSSVKDAIETVLDEMLAGGTGLPADVETAIWERARDREERGVEADISASIAQWSTRGFSHPPGQLNGQTIVLREKGRLKVNDLSRDVANKQADLEQKNRQFAVTAGLDYEKIFTAIFLAVVDRNFQIAKFSVESDIQIFNMLVTAFNVEQQVYAQKILKYKTDAEAAFLEVKAFEAEVSAVKAGAELNVSLVQVYGEKVKAYESQVSAYGETVKAATARSDLQKNKVELYKAQIQGAQAEVELQGEQFKAYDSKIRGETSKVQLEEANSRAYSARVQAIGEQATIIYKGVDANIAKDRLRLDWNIANMQRITTLNGQQVSQAQVQLAGYEAINRKAIARYDAELHGTQAQLQTTIELGRLQVARYEALTKQWQTRVQEIIQMAEIVAQSQRSAATVAANLAAGAMAGIHVSAGISASGNASQSSSRAVSDQTSHSENYGSNYSVNHNYSHQT